MAAEEKVDRRIQRTRQLLRDALMALIVERGYEPISIQDITDRANVSRTTFYLHYRDKDDLLFTSMTDMYNDLVSRMEQVGREDVQQGISEKLLDSTDFEHVEVFADFYRVLLGPKGSAAFMEQVQNYLAMVLKDLELKPLIDDDKGTRLPLDFMVHFIAGAEIGLMRWWLNNNRPYSPQEMAKMMSYLCIFGLGWAMRLDIPVPDEVE